MRKIFVLIAVLLSCAQLISGESAGVDRGNRRGEKSRRFPDCAAERKRQFRKIRRRSAARAWWGLSSRRSRRVPNKLRENNPAVAKAVKYIVGLAQPNGAIGDPKAGTENYNTSIAVIGLAALENPEYKPVLEKAKNFILHCQLDDEAGYTRDEHPRAYGGFSYGSVKRADGSNSGFSMEALNALGLEKDSKAWKNAVLFLKRCQDNDETNDDPGDEEGGENKGGFVYYPGKSEFPDITVKSGKKMPRPYGSMTYMDVKSLIYAGVKMDDPAMAAAFKWIKENYAVDHQPGAVATAGYYYYVMVMAKAFTAAGVTEIDLSDAGKKANWAKDLSAQLLKLQKPDGSFANETKRWMEDDPVLATAYGLEALYLCVQALKKIGQAAKPVQSIIETSEVDPGQAWQPVLLLFGALHEIRSSRFVRVDSLCAIVCGGHFGHNFQTQRLDLWTRTQDADRKQSRHRERHDQKRIEGRRLRCHGDADIHDGLGRENRRSDRSKNRRVETGREQDGDVCSGVCPRVSGLAVIVHPIQRQQKRRVVRKFRHRAAGGKNRADQWRSECGDPRQGSHRR